MCGYDIYISVIMDPHSSYWKNVFKLPETALSLTGHSRSTEMTCFYIPELGVYFDAGVHSYYSCDHIFVTHGHGDHIQSINGIIKSQNSGRPRLGANGLPIPLPVYCPKESEQMLMKYVESYFQLNAHNAYLKCQKIVEMVGVTSGERFLLTIRKRNYVIDVFECVHSVPTVGYGISEVRSKLRDEFVGKSQEELVTLKKAGTQLTNTIEVPLVCFLGDTTHEVFEKSKDIFKYPTIITECTFLEEDDIVEAVNRGHTHWSHLSKIIKSHPDNFFILIHFSLRYFDREIEKFFSDKLMKNMMVWLDSKPLISEEALKDIESKKDKSKTKEHIKHEAKSLVDHKSANPNALQSSGKKIVKKKFDKKLPDDKKHMDIKVKDDKKSEDKKNQKKQLKEDKKKMKQGKEKLLPKSISQPNLTTSTDLMTPKTNTESVETPISK